MRLDGLQRLRKWPERPRIPADGLFVVAFLLGDLTEQETGLRPSRLQTESLPGGEPGELPVHGGTRWIFEAEGLIAGSDLLPGADPALGPGAGQSQEALIGFQRRREEPRVLILPGEVELDSR